MLDLGCWALNCGFWALDFGLWIWGFGFWVFDFRFDCRFAACMANTASQGSILGVHYTRPDWEKRSVTVRKH